MKYRFTAIYSVKGLYLPVGSDDLDLIVEANKQFRVILTMQPDSHAHEADRSLALGKLLLRGLFRPTRAPGEIEQRVGAVVDEIRASRQKEFGNTPFLVILGEGEVESFNPSAQWEEEDYIVCLDGVPKDSIRQGFEMATNAAIASFVTSAENLLAVKKVSDSIVFFRHDGKRVYCYTLSGGASVYVSRLFAVEQAESAEKLYCLFASDKSLQRVQRLLVSSLETEEDTLRSFLSAWTALEIFINKVFKTYEEKFFKGMVEVDHPEAQTKYLERIRDVMKDKYRLGDKFAAISFQLSPETADDDYKSLLRAKSERDKLSHGEAVEEVTLPVKSVRELAFRYLRLHFEEYSRIAAIPQKNREPLE